MDKVRVSFKTGLPVTPIVVISMGPGTTAHLEVLRNGEPRDVTVMLGESPASKNAANQTGAAQTNPMRGVQVDELTPDIRQQLA